MSAKKVLAGLLMLAAIALVGPAIVLCYLGVFGHHISDDQGVSAALLLLMGFLVGAAGAFTAEFA